jgi:molybdopterin-guanine dinucleotide biosynthesis protein A
MSEAVLYLGAGKQERFKFPWRKCMTEINGECCLERLHKAWGDTPQYVTISDAWRLEEAGKAVDLGLTVVKPARYETIGQSVAAGLRAITEDIIYVISADTFILDHLMIIPTHDIQFIYDPYEHITIWKLDSRLKNLILKHEQDATDRLVMTQNLGMTGRILVSKNWININTPEDLDRAWRLENDTS